MRSSAPWLSASAPAGGQAVELSLFDNAVVMTGYATMQHLFTGANPQRGGNTSPDTCPSGVFQAEDCAFYINCGNDNLFQRLMSQVLDREDVASAEIYATASCGAAAPAVRPRAGRKSPAIAPASESVAARLIAAANPLAKCVAE